MILQVNPLLSSLVALNLQHTEEPDIMVVVAARTTEAVVVSNKAVPETSGVAVTLVPIVAEEHHGVVVTASLPLPKNTCFNINLQPPDSRLQLLRSNLILALSSLRHLKTP
jgi:hypothetical protein